MPTLRELARDAIETTKFSMQEHQPILEHARSTTVGALIDLIEEFEQRIEYATPREIRDYALELEQLSSMLAAEVWRSQR